MKRLIRIVMLMLASSFLAGGTHLALADTAADAVKGPLIVVVHLDIVRPNLDQALPLMRGYVAAARQEHGVRSAELLLQVGTANHFTLVETWDSQADYDAHNASAAVRDYRSRLFPFLASPYDDRVHTEVSAN
jgi:quinol monooxygenase YgiN